MTDRIAEIKARCEAATRGPWRVVGKDSWRLEGFPQVEMNTPDGKHFPVHNDADADFIANAREDIPYLLDLLAEREKGCSFCCYQEYPDKTLYPKEGYAFYAGFSKQIDVNDFDEIEIDEIKYCPICSRRLEAAHD